MVRYIRTVHDLAITLQRILDISARTYTRYFTRLTDDTGADDGSLQLIELAANEGCKRCDGMCASVCVCVCVCEQ